MANIIKDSVRKYVKDLISEGFKTKDNQEKSFPHERKPTADEPSSGHRRLKADVHQKRDRLEVK